VLIDSILKVWNQCSPTVPENPRREGDRGMSKRIHIVPHDAGWAGRREGASRVGSIYVTQAGAAAAARGTAIRERGEVVIHGRNGRIRDANSYGNDPFPPKG
jgi:hypothetical protein